MIEELLDLASMLASLAGGAFGAALGPLPAFVFTGFVVIAGEIATLVGGDEYITNELAWGPPFSPAISFAGGVAATAYAARKGYLEDFEYEFHQAKNIELALGLKPDVLAVGAAFGLLGYWMQTAFELLAIPTDPIALGVVLSAFFHRLVLGYSIIGKVQGSGILDMTPFERGETRALADGDGERASTDGGTVVRDVETAIEIGESGQRLAVEPWLPYQYRWSHEAAIGAVAGVLGGWIAVATGSPYLAFGISAATLLFLDLENDQTPVTHHITLPASTAALAVMAEGDAVLAGLGEGGALLVALVFGVVCALFAELFQRLFYAHGDTHVDPPAAAIVFGSTLVAIMYVAGIFPDPTWVPIP